MRDLNKAYPPSINKLIKEFSKMPGIGEKSAERMAFHLLKSPSKYAGDLILAIKNVKEKVRFCRECNNMSDGDICNICSDHNRDKTLLCVVENPAGIIAMERIGVFRGVYHVLLGAISPIDGVGPEDLKIGELAKRVKDSGVNEVVLATDFTTEGETTALYLEKFLGPMNVKVTRLARGVPVGACLAYADVATLQRAYEERRPNFLA